MKWLWRMPREIVFGAGRVEVVGRRLQEAGVRQALVVTDAGVRAAGLLPAVTGSLASAHIEHMIFAEVVPNPTLDNVRRALRLLHESGAEAVVALGGGSVIDVGKVVAAAARNPGDLEDLAGWQRFREPAVPLVAVPTTAGTGSEVSQYAVITGERQRRKLVYGGPQLLATWAVIDPELTHTLPPEQTAATGMDALTHAIEALVARGASELSTQLALDAIARIARHLPRAVSDGADADAREQMCYAQMLAGIAFSNAGLGAVHALAHQLGAVCGITHGVANAVVLPAVIEYNAPVAAEAYARAAVAFGASGDAAALAQRVRQLHAELGLPTRLSQLGVARELLPELAEMALSDPSLVANPRPATADELLRLLEAAY